MSTTDLPTSTTTQQPTRDTLPNTLRSEHGSVARATNADGVTVRVEFHQSVDRRCDFYVWHEVGQVFEEGDLHIALACNRESLADAMYDDFHLDIDSPIWARELRSACVPLTEEIGAPQPA